MLSDAQLRRRQFGFEVPVGQDGWQRFVAFWGKVDGGGEDGSNATCTLNNNNDPDDGDILTPHVG